MDFELKTLELAAAAAEKCDALVVLVPEAFKPGRDALSRLIGSALAGRDLDTKAGKLLQSYRSEGVAAPRLVLAGAGDGSGKRVFAAVTAAVAALRTGAVRRIVVCLPWKAAPAAVRAVVTAAAEASYVYGATKSKPESRELQKVVVGVSDPAPYREIFRRAQAVAVGVELARELANLPANVGTPARMGEEAKKLAKHPGVQCEVFGPKEIARLGMHSFLAVSQASRQPPRFIVLRYQGEERSAAPVVLVGKGITFDTGGISLKPAAEMDEMKFDMAGAASVLGTFRALAEFKPRLNVVGLVPCCENMPGGGAMKPGDVLTSLSGQTIEVLNTDAEGRLILCDALTYAERLKPRAVIDIATLTGACIVALGSLRSAMFSADETLAAGLLAAGETAMDLCWRMPLDEEYGEGLKSNFADVANVAGRGGGAIVGAKFLQRFTQSYPWAHLDIAGIASVKGGATKGATGRPVGLLFEYLASQAAEAPAAGKRAKPARAPRAKPAVAA